MAVKHYTFDYDMYEAEASFRVDTEIFTAEHANATLQFFLWDYDKAADPIDEVMKKYALEAIQVATFNNYNVIGVVDEFMNKEGFARIDGSMGITLQTVSAYEFNGFLDMTVKID